MKDETEKEKVIEGMMISPLTQSFDALLPHKIQTKRNTIPFQSVV
jgi:hypothetical protein